MRPPPWPRQHWEGVGQAHGRRGDTHHGAGKSVDEVLRTRTVRTGSFLTPKERGCGFGKQARAAVLHLAFDVLGARLAKTAALPNNGASRSVSLALGYREVGLKVVMNRGRPYGVERFRLERDRWEISERPWPVSTVGADALRRLVLRRYDPATIEPAPWKGSHRGMAIRRWPHMSAICWSPQGSASVNGEELLDRRVGGGSVDRILPPFDQRCRRHLPRQLLRDRRRVELIVAL